MPGHLKTLYENPIITSIKKLSVETQTLDAVFNTYFLTTFVDEDSLPATSDTAKLKRIIFCSKKFERMNLFSRQNNIILLVFTHFIPIASSMTVE